MPWGIPGMDHGRSGLIESAFNMIAMPDEESGNAIVAHFLAEALRTGARAALVSLKHPSLTLAAFASHGLELEHALLSEQLVYLYYKPAFLHSLSLATDYAALFGEVRRLAPDVSRLALLDAELCFNLQSEHLALASMSRAVAAARQSGLTVLGCIVPQRTDGHRTLHASCMSLMPLYVTGTRLPRIGRHYRLEMRRTPPGSASIAHLDIDALGAHGRASVYA